LYATLLAKIAAQYLIELTVHLDSCTQLCWLR
jgi:hypothetical protein